jgi:glycosyltransferase involved in cell wall biosynthesis
VSALGLDDRVTFTGLVPHERVPRLLAAADVGVVAHPDTVMGRSLLPLKLLEYMAAGLAVVAPATENLRDWLEDGRTARLYAPGDAAALAGALAHVLRYPAERRALGVAAQHEALAGHSWDHTAARIESLLQRYVLARQGGHRAGAQTGP